ncbi:MAG: MFS transporter [Bacteroidales bacterium]|nr:MFS transporter [Bacteroidales bacterium]
MADKRSERIFWLTFGLVILSWTSIKIVLPALPVLPNAFNCQDEGVKMSVSVYLILYACIQPFWGGMVQKLGCRKTLFYSMMVSIIGSLIAMSAISLPMYIIGRSLEGIGMGAASPVGRTMIANTFEKKELSRRIGLISGVAAAMPAVTPIIGGYLMKWMDWRAIFGFLLLISAVYLFIAYQRHPSKSMGKAKDDNISLHSIMLSYFIVLKSRTFWGYAIVYGTCIGGVMGYYSAMPYWYHSQLGVADHIFSYLAVPTVGMYIIGITLAGFLVKRHMLETIIFYGTIMTGLAAVVAILLASLGFTGIVVIVTVMSIFGFAGGLITPNANAGVLSRFREVAAPASALVSVVIFSTSSITSAIAMSFNIKDSIWSIAIYIAVLSFIAFVVGYFWIWQKKGAGG